MEPAFKKVYYGVFEDALTPMQTRTDPDERTFPHYLAAFVLF